MFCSNLVNIHSDDDCWSLEKNNTIDRSFATLVRFSPKIAYGKHSCSVHVTNPWTRDLQNGFGVFLSGGMDCSTSLTIECLNNDDGISSSAPFTCHGGANRIELACNSISLNFKRKLGTKEMKQTTAVQVVALAKGTCEENEKNFRDD